MRFAQDAVEAASQLAGCYTPDRLDDVIVFDCLEPKDERAIAALFLAEVLRRLAATRKVEVLVEDAVGASQDAALNAYLTEVGQGLARVSHRPAMPYSLRVPQLQRRGGDAGGPRGYRPAGPLQPQGRAGGGQPGNGLCRRIAPAI